MNYGASDRRIAQAVRRGKSSAQSGAVSFRDVDAQFLPESGREKFACWRRKILDRAKDELRVVFGRPPRKKSK
jgi:hypothetical protein